MKENNRLKKKEKQATQNDKFQKTVRSCFSWVQIWLNYSTKLKNRQRENTKNREKVQENYKN